MQSRGMSWRPRRRRDSDWVALGPLVSFKLDGAIIADRRRRKVAFPWHAVALVFVGILVLKAGAYAALGPVAYGNTVADLGLGNPLEQVVGWVLTAGPVTAWLSGILSAIAAA